MPTERLFGSPWETIKLLAKCLLASVTIIIVIGFGMFLLVHYGRVGLG